MRALYQGTVARAISDDLTLSDHSTGVFFFLIALFPQWRLRWPFVSGLWARISRGAKSPPLTRRVGTPPTLWCTGQVRHGFPESRHQSSPLRNMAGTC